jgi:hypothetical protein
MTIWSITCGMIQSLSQYWFLAFSMCPQNSSSQVHLSSLSVRLHARLSIFCPMQVPWDSHLTYMEAVQQPCDHIFWDVINFVHLLFGFQWKNYLIQLFPHPTCSRYSSLLLQEPGNHVCLYWQRWWLSASLEPVTRCTFRDSYWLKEKTGN